MPRVRPLVLLLVLLLASSAQAAITTVRVANGLSRPVLVTAPDGDLDRLFIVEQRGVIKILKGGSVLARPFLDIQSIVDDNGNEQGLLGMTFDPDFATNRLFYVYYTTNGSPRDFSDVVRYEATVADPDSADATTAFSIARVPQDFSNHNGGTIDFGPDGYLYWGLGDGGSGGDPNNTAQNPMEKLGKMLRMDPYGDDFPNSSRNNFAIPPDNPFVGDPNVFDSIWALGLRNPYRWSFDRLTGDMYIADVGQNVWEEIDFQPASSPGGENYGWRCYEGDHAFNLGGCGPIGDYVFPIHEYSHGQDGFSCSITGGYVYRGADIPELYGSYFYADYCSDQIYTMEVVGGVMQNLQRRTSELAPGGGQVINGISGFGEDGRGEMYIVDLGGEVFKIINDGETGVPDVERPTRFGLMAPMPNPFRGGTTLQLNLDRNALVEVAVYDAAGRLVRTIESGDFTAGVVTLHWDGRDAQGVTSAPGVYFVRATAGDSVATQRVTRLR